MAITQQARAEQRSVVTEFPTLTFPLPTSANPNEILASLTRFKEEFDRFWYSFRQSLATTQGPQTTDDLPEGAANLYFAQSRARASISATNPITFSNSGVIAWVGTTSNVPEGSRLYWSNTLFDTRFASSFTTAFNTALATKDTDDLTEGGNLYFTTARAISALLPTEHSWTAVQNFTLGINLPLAPYTSDPESGAYTGIASGEPATPYAQLTDLNALRLAYETLRAAYEDLRTQCLQ